MLTKIKNINPIILNITNLVVQTQTANALLAIGASPIMCTEINELNDILSFTHAVNLNLGTINRHQLLLIHETSRIANTKRIPLILDPVGAGATDLRTDTALHLLERYNITILRANAAEVLALDKQSQHTNTIDSKANVLDALPSAKRLSKQYQCIVIISGETDLCIQNETHHELHGGNALMSKTTGMGCVATALCAAFTALEKDPLHAAISCMTLMNQAGERAAKQSPGPGTFATAFIDALYQLTN